MKPEEYRAKKKELDDEQKELVREQLRQQSKLDTRYLKLEADYETDYDRTAS